MTTTEIKIIGTAFTERMKLIGLSASVRDDFLREGIIDDKNKNMRINDKVCKGIVIKRKIMESKLGLLDENKEENANISVNMKYHHNFTL